MTALLAALLLSAPVFAGGRTAAAPVMEPVLPGAANAAPGAILPALAPLPNAAPTPAVAVAQAAADGSDASREARARRDLARWLYARGGGLPMSNWTLTFRELGELNQDPKARAELAAIAADRDSLPLRRAAAADLLAALTGGR